MHHLTGFTEWKIIVEIPMQEGVSGDMDAEDKGTTGWLQCTDTFAVFFCFFSFREQQHERKLATIVCSSKLKTTRVNSLKLRHIHATFLIHQPLKWD